MLCLFSIYPNNRNVLRCFSFSSALRCTDWNGMDRKIWPATITQWDPIMLDGRTERCGSYKRCDGWWNARNSRDSSFLLQLLCRVCNRVLPKLLCNNDNSVTCGVHRLPLPAVSQLDPVCRRPSNRRHPCCHTGLRLVVVVGTKERNCFIFYYSEHFLLPRCCFHQGWIGWDGCLNFAGFRFCL